MLYENRIAEIPRESYENIACERCPTSNINLSHKLFRQSFLYALQLRHNSCCVELEPQLTGNRLATNVELK